MTEPSVNYFVNIAFGRCRRTAALQGPTTLPPFTPAAGPQALLRGLLDGAVECRQPIVNKDSRFCADAMQHGSLIAGLRT